MQLTSRNSVEKITFSRGEREICRLIEREREKERKREGEKR